MAADRISNTEDGHIMDLSESKIVRFNNDGGYPFLLAASGLRRITNELHNGWLPPAPSGLGPNERVRELVADLEEYFHAPKLWNTVRDKEQEDQIDARFLLGFRGRIWVIGPDFGYGELADGYGAICAGDEVALGALYYASLRTREGDFEPAEVVVDAVNAAIHHMAGMGPPIDVSII